MMRQGTFWAYNLRPPESERQRQANVHCSNIEIAKTWKQPKRPLTEEWVNKMWKTNKQNKNSSLVCSFLPPTLWLISLAYRKVPTIMSSGPFSWKAGLEDQGALYNGRLADSGTAGMRELFQCLPRPCQRKIALDKLNRQRRLYPRLMR